MQLSKNSADQKRDLFSAMEMNGIEPFSATLMADAHLNGLLRCSMVYSIPQEINFVKFISKNRPGRIRTPTSSFCNQCSAILVTGLQYGI